MVSESRKESWNTNENRRRTYHFSNAQNPLARHKGAGAETELASFLDALQKIALESGLDSGQLAIAWLRAQKAVTTIIAGCRNLQQLEANIRAMNIVLTPQISEALNRAGTPLRDKIGNTADPWQSPEENRVW